MRIRRRATGFSVKVEETFRNAGSVHLLFLVCRHHKQSKRLQKEYVPSRKARFRTAICC